MPKTTRAPRRRRAAEPEPVHVAAPVRRLAELPPRYAPVREQIALDLARGQRVWRVTRDGRDEHLLVTNPDAPTPFGVAGSPG